VLTRRILLRLLGGGLLLFLFGWFVWIYDPIEGRIIEVDSDECGGAIQLDFGVESGLERGRHLKVVDEWGKPRGFIKVIEVKSGYSCAIPVSATTTADPKGGWHVQGVWR
jgi:hypothetical protein